MKTILPLLLAAAVLVFCMPRKAHFSYNYKKGSAWRYESLVAQFDFPIYKTEEQLQEEMSSTSENVIPYYRYSEETVNRRLQAVGALDLGEYASIRGAISSAARDIYSHGVISDEGVKFSDSGDPVLFIQRNKRAVKHPASDVYKLSDARAKLLAAVASRYPQARIDSVFDAAGVYDIIVPNLSYDPQTTELVHRESDNYISPTSGYVSAGQLIVAEGEIITADIAQMLDSYKREYESNLGYVHRPALVWLGDILLALLLSGLLFSLVYLTQPSLLGSKGFLYIITVFLIMTLMTCLACRINEELLFLVPFSLGAIYLKSFFRNRTVFAVFVVTLLPLLVFSSDGAPLFLMNFAAGAVAIYTHDFFNKGWKQFINAMIIFAVMMTVYIMFYMLDIFSVIPVRRVLFIFLGCLLTVVGYPFVFLFEKAFDLVSSTRLAELCDTGSPAIRELESKAPGTFQHSLQVMNMADAAARAINADVPLVRAGALYHDIGKMSNPLCFVENESLVGDDSTAKYHSSLSARQSAHEIINHVSDGLARADRWKLPSIIKDFIITHHGTTVVTYFFHKFVSEGGDPADVADFTYKGMTPKTREQVILMLSDSLEAASRSLKEHTPEAYSELVESITQGKVEAGQLADADITIKELGMVKEALKSYLAQLYHDRIAYPKRNQ